jgi:hypothetical protein
MAEVDEYERRKGMTESQQIKEMVKKKIKNMFSFGKDKPAKAADKPAAAPPNNDLRKNIEDRNKALKEFKKGGKVHKTGPAKLHKGERVLTSKATKKLDKMPVIKKKLTKATPLKRTNKGKR